MHRLVALNCLTDQNNSNAFPSDEIRSLRRAILAPAFYKPNIQQYIKRHRIDFRVKSSFSNIIGECNDGEGQTLLMSVWDASESIATVSMSVSSCSSMQHQNAHTQKDLRNTAQQTEISCRATAGFTSAPETEERVMRARIADSLTFSSPASSLIHHDPQTRSTSILGSVCALLLNKQPSVAKPVPSFRGSGSMSENICRICFGGASSERLVSPCSCRGTIAAVHRSCLERWLLQASSSYCELCRHHYVVTRSHKWSWWVSLAQWLTSGRGRALLADTWRGAALALGSALGTARALHACDVVLQAGQRRGGGAALAANLLSSVIIGVIGALNGLLTTWVLLKIQEHQMSWQAWRDSTLHVRVTLQSDEDGAFPGDHSGTRPDDLTSPPLSRRSDVTVVGTDRDTIDRSTNVADPFMVALPFFLSEI